jgi:hypothetical protein
VARTASARLVLVDWRERVCNVITFSKARLWLWNRLAPTRRRGRIRIAGLRESAKNEFPVAAHHIKQHKMARCRSGGVTMMQGHCRCASPPKASPQSAMRQVPADGSPSSRLRINTAATLRPNGCPGRSRPSSVEPDVLTTCRNTIHVPEQGNSFYWIVLILSQQSRGEILGLHNVWRFGKLGDSEGRSQLMRWFRSNRGGLAWLAFFVLAC